MIKLFKNLENYTKLINIFKCFELKLEKLVISNIYLV